ncbi:hypothetical protein FM106_23785 [Brachybacterium faecium]|nr:hypothetical protein FM106_23785 [Brachybacterium faecium]
MGVGCLFLLRGHPHMLGHPRSASRAQAGRGRGRDQAGERGG